MHLIAKEVVELKKKSNFLLNLQFRNIRIIVFMRRHLNTIQNLPMVFGATMLTVGLIALSGLVNATVAPVRYSYEEQFCGAVVDAAQAAVTVFGSIDILVPTFKFELKPGYRVTTLGPADQLQTVVVQPSHLSTREQEKAELPGTPPWLVGESKDRMTVAPSSANIAESARGTGGAVNASTTTKRFACVNVTLNSVAEAPNRPTLIS